MVLGTQVRHDTLLRERVDAEVGIDTLARCKKYLTDVIGSPDRFEGMQVNLQRVGQDRCIVRTIANIPEAADLAGELVDFVEAVPLEVRVKFRDICEVKNIQLVGNRLSIGRVFARHADDEATFFFQAALEMMP